MRIYPEKGCSLTEPERLELGRLLLKNGLIVRLGKERQGNTTQYYVEYFRREEFGSKAAQKERDPHV